MALSSETRRSPRYIGTGSETIFPFAFKLLKPTDLEVRVALSGQVETTLEESAYTVVLNESQDNNPGGTVTLKAPLAKDAALVIISDTPYLQPTTYTNRGGFYPEQLNTNLDRLTILTQQLKEHLDRTITVPPTSPTSPQELFYQLLNAAKEALESAQSAEEALAACEQIRQLIEQYSWDIPHVVDSLRDVEDYPYDGLFAVGGFGNPGHKGQNISNRFVKAEGSTELRTLGERFADVVNVKDFGAKGDGTTDDTEAIQAALSVGVTLGREVVFPSGKYLFTRFSIIKSGHLSLRALGSVVLHSTNATPIDSENDYSILLRGESVILQTQYVNSIEKGATRIPRNSLSVQAGDLLILRSSRLVGGETRSSWTEGCVHKVVSVTDSEIVLSEPTHVSYQVGDLSAIVSEKIDTTHCKFSNVNSERRDLMHKCVCLAGQNADDWRWITDWDNETKTATFGTHSAATAPSHNREPWSYAPEVGDTFQIQKRVTVSIVKPIHVEISGDFTIERDFVDYDSTSSYRFIGLKIQWSDNSIVRGGLYKNFPYTNISFVESYFPTITNAFSENANDSGTGYGFLLSGNYRPRLLNCVSSGCRSGNSTANAGVQDVFGVVDNFTVYAGNAVASNGEARWPYGNVGNYGYGGHGNAFGFVYSKCNTFNVETGGSVRDYDATFLDCSSFGTTKHWLYAFNFCGLKALRCSADIAVSSEQTRFLFLHNNYDSSLPLIVDGCNAGDLTGAMVYFDSHPFEHKNIHLLNNRVNFVGTASFITGFGGGSNSQNYVGENCEFINNVATYKDYTGQRGFFAPRIMIQVKDNVPVSIGIDSWYVHITEGATVQIPLREALGVRYETTMTAGSSQVQTISSLLWPGENFDSSALHNYNKSSEINICSNSENAADGKINIYINNGFLIVENKTDINAYYIINVKGVNRN